MCLFCGSHRGWEERPGHCAGTRSRREWDGRRSRGEGFETTAPLGPHLRPRLGRRRKSVFCLRFPCFGLVPDLLRPAGVCRWGSAPTSPTGRGVRILVSAAGLLRCGRRTGKSPGREAAESEPQSWRREEGQCTSELRAPPASSATNPAAGVESASRGPGVGGFLAPSSG